MSVFQSLPNLEMNI
nr:unnamed protein product [Callosobruchus analis]